MSETATYKQTTFANVANTLEQYENQQSQTENTEPATETSSAVVNENGNLGTEGTQETTTTETQQVVEENVSTFDLGEPEQKQDVLTETAQPQPTFNWKDEIKKLNPKEVAKELGLNDFTLEMNEYLSKGGKAEDYLNARAVDYNNISDEDLIKGDMKRQFPNLSSQQINSFYNKKYGVSEDALEDEREFADTQRSMDAHLIRQKKIVEQSSFKIPEAIIPQIKDEAYEQWKQAQEAQPVLMKQLSDYYSNHQATKALNESKRVAVNLGEGVPAFNFSINNPEALNRVFTDGGETWQKLTSTPTGEPDVPKQHLISLFTHNPQKFVQDIYNYGIQMGKRKLMEEGQNATRPQQKAMPQELNQTSYGIGKFGDRARN
jgi:hypothetical protein